MTTKSIAQGAIEWCGGGGAVHAHLSSAGLFVFFSWLGETER